MSRRPTLRGLCLIVIAIALVNFVSYMIIRARAGGTPLLIQDGHYYLYNRNYPGGKQVNVKDAGVSLQLTEVPRSTYLWVYWHEQSQLVTFPAGVVAIGLFDRAKKQTAPGNSQKDLS